MQQWINLIQYIPLLINKLVKAARYMYLASVLEETLGAASCDNTFEL